MATVLAREKRSQRLLFSAARTDPIALEREICARSLREFVRRGWHVLEPGMPLEWGWALDALCEHLEAVSSGEIKRLIINVPPGTMKSLSTCVFFPAWEWGPAKKPHLRHATFAYAADLAARDNRRCRNLIRSEWYQRRWGDVFSLAKDQNEKVNFENDAFGFRQAAGIGSGGTGKRADRLIIDDPISVKDGDSQAALIEAQRWVDETMPTRLISPKDSAIIFIMQRVHEADPTGHIIARDMGWDHLMLPMEFEPERRCRTSIGFEDPRTQDGELLFEARFPREVVDRDKRMMGSYAVASQFQQRPAPRGGGLLQVDKLHVVDDWPRDAQVIRAWDFAGTEEKAGIDPDYTVGAKLAMKDGLTWILDVVRFRKSPGEVENMVAAVASRDGTRCPIEIPQDPGSAGKAVVDHYTRRVLRGFEVRAAPVSGSKVQRAGPFAASVEAGNVALVRGPWIDDFLAEARVFPAGAHDDQIDAVTLAWTKLADAPLFYVGG